jgi:cellulose biosynthesis protein BcsQ
MDNEIITIWGNAEFGCELAYSIAKYSDLNVLLIDLDFLAPSVDIHMGVQKYPDKIVINKESTGYDILMDSVEKNYITNEIIRNASIKRKELGNLYIITGCYDIGK